MNVARYAVLRMLLFFGFLCALWLLGLRDQSQRWWLLGLSALGSMVVSYPVLRGPRAVFSASIASHVDQRARRAELPDRNKVDGDAPEAQDPRTP